ncbi:MAG: helix-turn-helix domain-containing protein [Ferrovibrio sp.]
MLEGEKTSKRLLTIKDFVAEYGPSRSVVYQLIGSGELQAVKFGKRTYITRDAAEAWIKTLAQYEPNVKHVRRNRRQP